MGLLPALVEVQQGLHRKAFKLLLLGAASRSSPTPFPHPLLQAKQQQHSRSLGRLKEQLHWVATETDALKRQLSDRDKQLASLRREGAGGGGGSLTGGGSFAGSGWRGGGGL